MTDETNDDIHVHHINKLRQVNTDIAQTCQIAGLSQRETIEIIMSGLLLEFIKGAMALGLNETEFMKICRIAYRAAKENFNE